jgi:hypothetical protein
MTEVAFDRLIAKCWTLPDARVITIGGESGSGKSHLAERLASALQATWLDFDDLLPDTPPSVYDYVALIDVEEVARRISMRETPRVVVSGLCMRDILDRSGIKDRFEVYVKRTSRQGLWHFGIDLEDAARGAQQHDCGWLEACDLKYHLACRPHEGADFVYERVVD